MHVTPYTTDIGGCLAIAIDGSKGRKERIHAGLGAIDYAECTFDVDGVMNAAPDCGEEECCAKIRAALSADGPGMKAVDWSKLWQTIRPYVKLLVAALLG